MKKLLIFALALFAFTAIAQAAAPTFTVVWTAPTTNTDSTPITGAITYQLYTGVTGAEVKFGSPVTAPPYVITPTPAPGSTLCVYVTAIVNGMESPPSGEACGTMPKPVPNGPTTVVITIK